MHSFMSMFFKQVLEIYLYCLINIEQVSDIRQYNSFHRLLNPFHQNASFVGSQCSKWRKLWQKKHLGTRTASDARNATKPLRKYFINKKNIILEVLEQTFT